MLVPSKSDSYILFHDLRIPKHDALLHHRGYFRGKRFNGLDMAYSLSGITSYKKDIDASC